MPLSVLVFAVRVTTPSCFIVVPLYACSMVCLFFVVPSAGYLLWSSFGGEFFAEYMEQEDVSLCSCVDLYFQGCRALVLDVQTGVKFITVVTAVLLNGWEFKTFQSAGKIIITVIGDGVNCLVVVSGATIHASLLALLKLWHVLPLLHWCWLCCCCPSGIPGASDSSCCTWSMLYHMLGTCVGHECHQFPHCLWHPLLLTASMVDVAGDGVRSCICLMCLMLVSCVFAMSNACARVKVPSFDKSSRWTFGMVIPAMSCFRILSCVSSSDVYLHFRACIFMRK